MSEGDYSVHSVSWHYDRLTGLLDDNRKRLASFLREMAYLPEEHITTDLLGRIEQAIPLLDRVVAILYDEETEVV